MKTPFLPFIFLLFFSPAASDLAGDAAALLTFRSAVGRFVLPWNATVSPCIWPGVTCSGNGVTSLRLPASGLIGRIPAGTLANLSNLQTLSLRYNALAGVLPSDLVRCKQLRNLYLQSNRFSGEIPAFLSSLKSLVRLNLADNNFSGAIPPELNNLARLRTLYLENNHLTGEIPELNFPNLEQFNVSFNQLNGSVPAKLRGNPASAFLGMSLCGGPLAPCPGEPAGKRSKLSGGAIAGIIIAAIALALVLLVAIILLLRRKKGKAETAETGELKPPEIEVALRDEGTNVGVLAAGVTSKKKMVFFANGPRVYDLEDLLRASAEVLGKGTFGTTYKAVLENGGMVAVKRLKDANTSEKEFREKIEEIGVMNHPNIVALQGYYHSKDEKLLVYDYMAMGSLSSLLHGNRGSGRTPLNWETRTGIALAAGRGIEYIHSTSPIASHGNIKSSNILLTSSSEARVSDHGLAHLVGLTSTSNRVAGYRAPEVTDARRVSQKADVYSFGVLLLELLTGKAPSQALLNEDGVDLPRWVQSVVHEEWTSEVFDMELLRYQNVEEEMVELLQLGVNCSAQYPDQRPTMAAVVAKIEEIHHSNVEVSKEE